MIIQLGLGELEICPYLLDRAGGQRMEKSVKKRAVIERKAQQHAVRK